MVNTWNFLMAIILAVFLCLTSCDFIYTAGTLGSIGVYQIKCDTNLIFYKLDSLENSYGKNIPSDYSKFDTWNENGYDFLKHWTFYNIIKQDTFYYWVTNVKGRDNPAIGISAIFRNKTKVWTKAINIASDEGQKLNKILEKNVLDKLECNYFFSD